MSTFCNIMYKNEPYYSDTIVHPLTFNDFLFSNTKELILLIVVLVITILCVFVILFDERKKEYYEYWVYMFFVLLCLDVFICIRLGLKVWYKKCKEHDDRTKTRPCIDSTTGKLWM